MKNSFLSLNSFRGLLHLFFPKICIACDEEVPMRNNVYCLDCQQQLYYTDHLQNSDNEFERMFYGRIKLERGAAMFYYRKKTAIQKIIHRFNYSGAKEIGKILGNEFAHLMIENNWGEDIDVVVPVPMHWRKERKRGYNQATVLAYGIAETLKVKCIPDALIKAEANESQTKKSRAERIENVKTAFTQNEEFKVDHLHVLLVDDVLTTGATLEACANILPPNCKISMATLAIGRL